MVTLAVAGAGLRGLGYARHAAAQGAKIVAVAEPDDARRIAFAEEFGVEHVFTDWTELVQCGRIADAVIVATQDRMHADPAVALLAQGWHMLLEKPMAPDEEESRRITKAAETAGSIFAVCHVLRYTAYTQGLMKVLNDGVIGRVVSVQHLEPVGWWHQAHSFVRGNWRREDESGPMLLTKSCHDIDWLMYVVGQPVRRVSSFGSLSHFKKSEKPAGAGDNCLDCRVEPDCPYSAPRLYLSRLDQNWPLSAVTRDRTPEGVRKALQDGQYGRCVYECDNDVVDHQVVNLEFEGGVTAAFTMTAFTRAEQRHTRIFGTHGCIEGDGINLRITDFRTGRESTVEVGVEDGHGGGDERLVQAFLEAVRDNDPGKVVSNAAQSLAGHLVVWAAERSRQSGETVKL